MKNYLFCILLGLSFSLNAQTLPTQIQNYDWNASLFDWVLRTSDSYQYDDRDSLRVTDSQSNWFGPSRFIVTKDENGNITQTLSLWLDENDRWVNSSRSTITIDANGRESNFSEVWVDDHWEPQFLNHILTTEVADGLEIDRQIQKMINGVWTNTRRFYSKQNHEGFELSQRHYEWENNAWGETFRYENQYDEYGNLVYSETFNFASQDLRKSRSEYTYNAAGQILTIREETAYDDPNIWSLKTEVLHEYDSQNRETLYERKWVEQNRLRREEKSYQGDTTILSIYQSRNNGPLEGVTRRWSVDGPERYPQYIYWRVDNWENGIWVPRTIMRRTPSFDQYDNIIRVDHDEFIDGNWQPQFYHTNNWEYREDGEPIKRVSLEYNYHTERQTPYHKMIWRYEDRKKRSDRPLIAITPNPSTGPLNVIFHSAPVKPIRWELLDPAGRRVRGGEINEENYLLGLELFIDELQFGFYILQIQYEDGSTVAKKWQKI